MPLTTYAANKIGDHLFRHVAFTSPATVYAALFTSPTTDAGGGTEATGGGYTRVNVTALLAAFASKAASNSAEIDFPAATADLGLITHYAFYDASSGGNMLAHNPMLSPQTVKSGSTPVLPVGALNILIN